MKQTQSFRFAAYIAVGALSLGVVAAVRGEPVASRRSAPDVSTPVSIPVGEVPLAGLLADAAVDPAADAAWQAEPDVTWPKAGRARVPVARGIPVWTRAGGLPVAVTTKSSTHPAGPERAVDVELLDRDTARAAGVEGLLLRLRPDGLDAGLVTVGLDYSAFRHAYGGDWSRRLRVLQLSDDAATEVASTNDVEAGQISALVSLPESGTVLALAAGDSSDSGDYKATSLTASATWTAGGSSGDFAWSYPMRAPPAMGGPQPQLSIGYSAQSVDGRTVSANAQPSWIGEGFDLATSYIERKYATCADDGQSGKYDLCWKYDNATLVLNGNASELVRDDATGKWRLKEDDGSRVERLTNPAANGDNDREYWRVTTVDGTRYHFGLHQLPGWTSGKPVTNSVWTVPVAGNNAGEPCHSSSGFSASFCNQAWRWNLDYVLDPHGNVMTAWYSKETNYYARNGVASPGVAYDRGGWLGRIEYGQRDNTIFSTAAPMRVMFNVEERCLPTASETCASLTSSNKSAWPDVPFDLICNAGSSCTGKVSPTFFTRKRLTKVTTQVRRGIAYADVDSWVLTHSFPAPGDGGTPVLWLSRISHTGHVNGTVSLPDVRFSGTMLVNRVDAIDGIAPMTKWRLRTITSETGAVTTVNYAPVDCSRSSLPDPATNTKRCFPVYWTPPGKVDPELDWFHKYVVEQVLEVDGTGGGPIVQTDFIYGGGAAWHYDDDDGLSKNKYRTWSHWRGYQTVTKVVGDPALGSARLKTQTLYFRGMDGDRTASGGTKSVTVVDSQGVGIRDITPLAGLPREETTFNGGTVVSSTIDTPWTYQTASRAHSWGTIRAYFVREASSRTRTLLASGGTRWARVDATFDTDYGLRTQVSDLGDEASSADDRCTRYTYARNTNAYLIDFVSRTETVGVACTVTPSRPADVISDVRASFDGQAWGAAPVRGDETKIERVTGYTSGAPVYQTVGTFIYDSHGRATSATDALGHVTTTAYTPSTGGPVTSTKVTNPLGHATTTMYEPAWGSPVKVTDTNGNVTEQSYDALGRLTAVWLANRSRSAGQNPNHKFDYAIESTKPVAVSTHKLRDDGVSYTTSFEIYDSWLRPRQIQAPAPGGGRVISDTSYDSRGLAVRVLDDIYNSDPPSGTLAAVNAGAAPSQKLSTYDGAGRVILEQFLVLGQERWRTTTSHGGDRVSVDPPTGGIAFTEISDARGRVIERRQYDGGAPSGSYSATKYTYDAADRLIAVINPAGTMWTFTYDLQGRKVRDADPDKGVTTSTYDNLDRLVSTTDARGQTLHYTYDALGRKTGLYSGSVSPANQLAAWTYDTVSGAKGQLASATRYVGGASGNAYTSRVTAYDKLYRPTRQQVIIPAVEGALAGTYTTTSAYNIDGTLQLTALPSAGGLPTEVLTYGYNELDMPAKLAGLTDYVRDTHYTKLGQPEQYTLATSSQAKHVWLTMLYEAGTGRLARAFVADETNPTAAFDRHYTYDAAGNPTRIADVAGTDDVQCFRYDGHQRLNEAWTPSSGICGTPAVTDLGGPAPYWLSWTYTLSGLRASQVDHRGTGDIATTYTYPSANAAHPHSLLSAGGMSYTYDAAGNTTTRPGASGPQSLTWDSEGRLATITEGASVSENLYDADGSRLIRRDPNETVLYLGATEVHLSRGGVLSGVRHYQHNGETVAVRTNSGLTWLLCDVQGTPQVAIDATTQAQTRRYQTPFGGPRGTQPGSWPSQKSFVGGVADPATGLVRMGAREYDPVVGRFLSVDPVMLTDDPQSLAAYTYANNNPMTFSDGTGLYVEPGVGGKAKPKKKKPAPSSTARYKRNVGTDYVQTTSSRSKPKYLRNVGTNYVQTSRRSKPKYERNWSASYVASSKPSRRPAAAQKKDSDCGVFSGCIFRDPGRWLGERGEEIKNATRTVRDFGDWVISSRGWTYAKIVLGIAAIFVCTLCTGAAILSAVMSGIEAGVHLSYGRGTEAGLAAIGVATYGATVLTGRAVKHYRTVAETSGALGLPWAPRVDALYHGAQRGIAQAERFHAFASVVDSGYGGVNLASDLTTVATEVIDE